MVCFDVFFSIDFGVIFVVLNVGCCNMGVEQFVSISLIIDFFMVNIKM